MLQESHKSQVIVKAKKSPDFAISIIARGKYIEMSFPAWPEDVDFRYSVL